MVGAQYRCRHLYTTGLSRYKCPGPGQKAVRATGRTGLWLAYVFHRGDWTAGHGKDLARRSTGVPVRVEPHGGCVG